MASLPCKKQDELFPISPFFWVLQQWSSLKCMYYKLYQAINVSNLILVYQFFSSVFLWACAIMHVILLMFSIFYVMLKVRHRVANNWQIMRILLYYNLVASFKDLYNMRYVRSAFLLYYAN